MKAWSACADAQADLDLRCPHMLKRHVISPRGPFEAHSGATSQPYSPYGHTIPTDNNQRRIPCNFEYALSDSGRWSPHTRTKHDSRKYSCNKAFSAPFCTHPPNAMKGLLIISVINVSTWKLLILLSGAVVPKYWYIPWVDLMHHVPIPQSFPNLTLWAQFKANDVVS